MNDLILYATEDGHGWLTLAVKADASAAVEACLRGKP